MHDTGGAHGAPGPSERRPRGSGSPACKPVHMSPCMAQTLHKFLRDASKHQSAFAAFPSTHVYGQLHLSLTAAEPSGNFFKKAKLLYVLFVFVRRSFPSSAEHMGEERGSADPRGHLWGMEEGERVGFAFLLLRLLSGRRFAAGLVLILFCGRSPFF